MAYPYEYPYTDPNRHNDDWALNKVKELMKEWADTWDAFPDLKEAFESFRDYVLKYFDNLDLTSEVREILNEYLNSGVISELLGEFITMQFYDVAGCDIAGQVAVEGAARFSTQCMVADENYLYVVCCAEDLSATWILKYAIETGYLVARYDTTYGTSVGSCGFNGSDLVLAVGHQYIGIMSTSGEELRELHFDFNVSECTCDENTIYILTDTNDFVRCDMEGNILSRSPFPRRNLIMQSMSMYKGLLAISMFDSTLRAYAVVLYSTTGVYVTAISIPVKTEFEGIAVVRDKTYGLCNNFGTGTLFELTLDGFPIKTSYVATHNNTKQLVNIVNVAKYFDSDSYNLWCDGSSADKALNKLRNVYNIFNDYVTRLDVYLNSDFAEEDLVLRSNAGWFRIFGNNHTMKGVYVANNNRLTLRDVTLNLESYTGEATLYCEGGSLECVNVTINTDGKQYQLQTENTMVILTNCAFTGTCTSQNIRIKGGYCEIYTNLTVENPIYISMDGGFYSNYEISNPSLFTSDCNIIGVATLGSGSKRLGDLNANGTYRVLLNTTFSDVPMTGSDTGGMLIVSTRAGVKHVYASFISGDIYDVIISSGGTRVAKITTT